MSRGSNVSSKNKSTVPADVIVNNTVRKVRRAASRDSHNIDNAGYCRERIAVAAYYELKNVGLRVEEKIRISWKLGYL